MRRLVFALSFIVFAACESETAINPATVHWMDWPAEVASGQPFLVRMLVSRPCVAHGFREGVSADESAVTFAPYFLEVNNEVLCLQAANLTIGALDTTGRAPGLSASFPRSYEIRGAADVYAGLGSLAAALPIRTFGHVVVRPENPDGARRNAAGRASVLFDNEGCRRLYPMGVYLPEDFAPLADQNADPVSYGFVRGYFADAPAPVCGESRVFHLVSVN